MDCDEESDGVLNKENGKATSEIRNMLMSPTMEPIKCQRKKKESAYCRRQSLNWMYQMTRMQRMVIAFVNRIKSCSGESVAKGIEIIVGGL